MSTHRAVACTLLSALAAAGACGAQLAWLAPVAWVPWFLALRGQPAKRGAALGALHGLAAGAFVFHWLPGAPAFGWFELLPFALHVAAGGALVGGAIAWCGERAVPSLGGVLPAAILCAVDALRAHLGVFSLPWAGPAHALVGFPAALQVVAFGGEAAGTFLVGLVNGALAILLGRVGNARPALAALAGAAAMLVLGMLRLELAPPDTNEAARVVALRTELSAAQDGLTPKLLNERFDALRDASRAAVGTPGSVDWLVWPESALGQVAQTPALRRELGALARELDVEIVLGASESRIDLSAGRLRRRNLAWHVRSEGELAEPYAKRRLLPFAEYLPGPAWLPWPEDWRELSFGIESGREAIVFEARGTRAAPLVCWESVFARSFRDAERRTARLFFVLSNEAWFASRWQAEQHLGAARIRAAESGRAIVAATNAGPAALIDPWGRIVTRTAGDGAAAVRGELPLVDALPLAQRGGADAFLAAIVAGLASALLFPAVRPLSYAIEPSAVRERLPA